MTMSTNASTEKRNSLPGTPTAASVSQDAASVTKSTTTKKKKPKKKATPKKSSASNTNAINTLARIEYKKLLAKRQAKLHDQAWLSTIPNPPTPTSTSPDINIDSPAFLDQDVEIVHKALQNNGLSTEDVTAEAFECLLQQARKYAIELITDAADYAVHSHDADNITPADLLLAKEMQSESDFSPDNIDTLAKIAHETNRRVLPPIPDHCYNGIVLPDPEYTLLGRAFDIVPRRVDNRITSAREGSIAVNVQEKGGKEARSMPSYGARRGQKQVQISLKSQRENMDIS